MGQLFPVGLIYLPRRASDSETMAVTDAAGADLTPQVVLPHIDLLGST